jgi:hypothetical protein
MDRDHNDEIGRIRGTVVVFCAAQVCVCYQAGILHCNVRKIWKKPTPMYGS